MIHNLTTTLNGDGIRVEFEANGDDVTLLSARMEVECPRCQGRAFEFVFKGRSRVMVDCPDCLASGRDPYHAEILPTLTEDIKRKLLDECAAHARAYVAEHGEEHA